jgi:hypothetical protein
MEKKQTAVEWLASYIKGITDLNCDEIIEQAKQMEKEQNQLELPTDEELDAYVKSTGYYGHCTDEFREGIELGAKWMRDKIKGGNNE